MSRKRIFLSPPHMSGAELEYVKQAFASNYIAPLGPMVDRFEAEFSEKTGIPHCLALSSGTAAMHLVLRILGVGMGDVALASSLTFIGSVSPVTFLGAEPCFIDSDPNTCNIDATLLEKALKDMTDEGRKPKVVIPTDLYGQCCDYDRLSEVCSSYDVPLVIDSAEAMGSRYKGNHAGSSGVAAVFSFNGNKTITTSGGGMLASHDSDLIKRARFLSTQAREDTVHYEHKEIGYNYRMSNILAAIGCGQLEALDSHVADKQRVFLKYKELLGNVDGISFLGEPAYSCSNKWLTVVLIDKSRFGASHEDVRLALEKLNIESRPLWKPMHMQPVFKNNRCFGGAVSESLFEQGLCLPSGSALSDDDISCICEAICACS